MRNDILLHKDKISPDLLDILKLSDALGEQIYKIERQKLGYDYCDIGGYLAEQWDLPSGIPQTTLNHEDLARTADSFYETSIVQAFRSHCRASPWTFPDRGNPSCTGSTAVDSSR